ncbi:tyrosine-type recombinase/integrase [Sandarakinorhabdus limnophila]|uniref:tyrosine-type recombinase/integrase n=1 Tax=Sandarakinorhabdus limnophila TaxID=210512 RepID=UPI0026F239F7|nr:site-specific integrase [Sandarakinorhabdus limnophila]MCM0032084.1 site-specific integrase [Sandarakinorhabdus limnophila]
MANALNRQAIETLISHARLMGRGQLELVDDREAGLRIRAGERGATWSLLVRLRNGKRTRVAIGPWPGINVADARKMAQDKKREIADGTDPNAQRRELIEETVRAEANQRSLRDVLDEYQAIRLSQLRGGDAVRRALDGKSGVLRALVHRDPRSIVRADVADAIRKHALKSPIGANRGLAYARAFFNWCVVEEILDASPAATIKKPSKEHQRDRYHSLDELREIWDAAGTLGYPFGPFYRLQILIPMRRKEVAGMPLAELDLGSDDAPGDAVWTLPRGRTKRDNALRVPLSPMARSIIKSAIADPGRPPTFPFVFSMTGDTPVSGFTKAKRRLDAAIFAARKKAAELSGVEAVPMPHWTVHDLRTTFSTQACDTLEIDIAVVDRILNHVATATTSKIMRVYNKSELFEPRKRALADWANLIERLVGSPNPSGTCGSAYFPDRE